MTSRASGRRPRWLTVTTWRPAGTAIAGSGASPTVRPSTRTRAPRAAVTVMAAGSGSRSTSTGTSSPSTAIAVIVLSR